MQQIPQEMTELAEQIRASLDAQVAQVAEELQSLVARKDWDAIKSVRRVLDAHARAHTLRAQGQPARAHLWLVSLDHKPRARRKSSYALPA